MTDHPPDASGGQRRPRGAPRLGDSGAPVTTVVVLAVAVVAVIAGFLILRSITDATEGGGDALEEVPSATTTDPTTPPSTAASSTTTTSTTTTTTTPPASKADATVVVANASGVDGSATDMSEELEGAGYTVAPVANATGPRLERSVIYYVDGDQGALGVARLLAEQIPTAQTEPMPDPPPLDRPLDAATVALLLGRDAAGRSLAALQTD